MRTFLLILILIFNIQSLVKADDITDLEIQGVAVGDNALDHFSKKILDDNKDYYPNSNKIWRTFIIPANKQFDIIQMHIKSSGNNYEILSIAGILDFENRTQGKEECLDKRDQIVNDLKEILPNTSLSEEEVNKHDADISGKSFEYAIFFDFKDDYSEYVKIGCTITSDEYLKNENQGHYLRLSLTTSEYHFWLKNEAY
tara:strand:+ start:115 stop:711 length:597 start_codon:yes stop_codon:yes gene_type:complete